ncbi:MAG: hypothetical protein UY52_C0011G0036 [Parcubacteria group bacterium GW2011_GWC2_49_9]|nr:MAG: hypothetical protein UY34_C0019G0044 [Parcubacteria group bacterium GW2011_GWA2_48_9]KKW16048.1 MAG: hypothetical protein UY52_C0011G0036 [Parcubacteria group bacterium GW2011_GWC2_49_9]
MRFWVVCLLVVIGYPIMMVGLLVFWTVMAIPWTIQIVFFYLYWKLGTRHEFAGKTGAV